MKLLHNKDRDVHRLMLQLGKQITVENMDNIIIGWSLICFRRTFLEGFTARSCDPNCVRDPLNIPSFFTMTAKAVPCQFFYCQ
jgi:hypothetical protein